MGIVISIFNLPKHYNNLIDFHKSINGNLLAYLLILYKCVLKKYRLKGRFDIYDAFIDGDPYAIGLLPHREEWIYDCPQKTKAENVLIYGTNSWGQYMLIQIECRPKSNHKIDANVKLVFKDENGLVYELNEQDQIKIETKGQLKEYRLPGIVIQVLSPFRKLRISVCGYLRRRDTNELVFSKFRLFWSSLSNVFDFQDEFDDNYIAKELSALGLSTVRTEDRHEQWGQITGSVQFDNQKSKLIYLWGNKAKQYLHNNQKIKGFRVYGFSSKSFAFHIGVIRLSDNYRLRYGYVSLGSGVVHSITGITSTINEIESIGSILTKLKIEVKDQNQEFDIEIEKSSEEYNNIMICDLKLNGHKGKCVVVSEDLNENINAVIEELPTKEFSDLVLSISDLKSQNVGLSGGKGASLAALTQLANESKNKFIVPKGLIVTTISYNRLINELQVLQNVIEELEDITGSENKEEIKKCCEKVSERFSSEKLTQSLYKEIESNLISIFGEDFKSIRFAVRSSALTEDSAEMSSAGQMTTILGVKGMEEISEAVMKCWSSQFSFVAVEYKRGYGQELNSPMAVVIQSMVNCDSAGVIFTCDPLTGDERHIFITANYGIGESVVSALAEPDTIKLSVNIEANSLLKDRTIGDIESTEIGSKLKSIILSDNNESGTVEINTRNNNNCCLSESESRTLAEVSLEIHRFYGNPRDIEWGIKENQIYLLQSRPITHLDNWTDWEVMHEMDSGQQSETEYLSRANLGEVFPGAASHLCLTWLLPCWNVNGFRNWGKIFNISKKGLSPFYNRGGANVNNQYFFLLKTGTFPFAGDPKSMISKSIQMGIFGHEFNGEEFDDLIKDSNEKAPKVSISLYRKLWLFFGSIKYFLTPGRTLRQAKADIRNTDLFESKIAFTSKEVFDVIVKSSHLTGPIAYAHGKATFCSMVYNVFLINILRSNSENENDRCADFASLVSCTSQVVSAQVPNLLREIVISIENPQQFRDMSDEKALKYLLKSETKAAKMFKQFLVEYGHRGYKEFDPHSLQWADNPILVIKSLKTMMSGNQSLSETKKGKSIDETISSLKTKLSFSKKVLLKYLLIPFCRSGVSLREQSKHAMIWHNNLYRQAFWRMARLMVSEGRIPDPELLFHMTLSEVEILLNQRDPSIVARARLRKKLHPIQENYKFPETSVGPNIEPRNSNTSEFESVLSNGETARIKGTPVSAGKVKARCCVAMNLEEAQNIQNGDILITYSTDICWSPYFPMLSGLATEIGGLISHGAVIAREYGLPCLVGVDGAHRLFKTGDIIVIDSEIGEIYKIE